MSSLDREEHAAEAHLSLFRRTGQPTSTEALRRHDP
jgi:hypothetical protein